MTISNESPRCRACLPDRHAVKYTTEYFLLRSIYSFITVRFPTFLCETGRYRDSFTLQISNVLLLLLHNKVQRPPAPRNNYSLSPDGGFLFLRAGESVKKYFNFPCLELPISLYLQYDKIIFLIIGDSLKIKRWNMIYK